MNIALLLTPEDVQGYLPQHSPEHQVIANGVETFLLLEDTHIKYERLSQYQDIKSSFSQIQRASKIATRFVNQPTMRNLLNWNMNFSYPFQKSLRDFLTEIIRSHQIAKRIIEKYRPQKVYVSSWINEPLLQKTHSAQFTLINYFLVQLSLSKNISIINLYHGRNRFNFSLIMLIFKNVLENFIHLFKKRSSINIGVDIPHKRVLLLSASNHQLKNLSNLIVQLKKEWILVIISKLKPADYQLSFLKKTFTIKTNNIIQVLSTKNLVFSIYLMFGKFIQYLSLRSQSKSGFISKQLDIDATNIIEPYLKYCFSIFLLELTKNFLVLEQIFQERKIDFIFASNNMDPFNTSLMFFTKNRKIPYLLIMHCAQADTFYDFFFEPHDHLALWGNFQKRLINQDYPHIKCHVTGYPEFDRYIKKSFRIEHNNLSLTKKNSIRILILTAHDPVIQAPNQEIIYDLLLELNKITSYKLNVILRPHPSEDHSFFVRTMKPLLNYRIATSNDRLVSLVNQSDLILTQSTSAGIYPILFHKPLIYYNVHAFPDIVPYAKMNAAIGIYSIQDVLPAIQRLLEKPNLLYRDQSRFLLDFCHKADGHASDRIVNTIDRIATEKYL